MDTLMCVVAPKSTHRVSCDTKAKLTLEQTKGENYLYLYVMRRNWDTLSSCV